MARRSPLARLRQPNYTGENRCLPCTVVNLVLVAVVAAAAGLFAPLAGLTVATLGAGAVWLRGYVVPGTPELTKRYLSSRVLAWFGKAPTTPTEPPEGDPVEKLVALGVLEDDETALAPAFERRWHDTSAGIAADPDQLRATAGAVLSVDADAVAVDRSSGGGVTLTVNDGWTGSWPSRGALAADLATERLLADRGFAELDRLDRTDLAARVRGLTERCPVCDSPTDVTDDTVESCCGSAEVVAVACTGCGTRMAEFDPSPAVFAPGS
ncbi:hypothetical protein N0B31_15095 [Salinirubellus salinus]|uniref:Uncharacterized protein n=1 Tax=Salinirubellus salinus TaxID=1364945 RepID=A0A9E7U3P0_9EURY|nr:hypothetical protein [Salinirubellus salinus]UWM53460.1 hypothetical protein N0B31_15095 [Salinirubellus salinus]